MKLYFNWDYIFWKGFIRYRRMGSQQKMHEQDSRRGGSRKRMLVKSVV